MRARSSSRGRRSWPQRLLITFNILVALAALVAAGGFGLARQKASQLNTVVIGSTGRATDEVDAARNILLVGTDSSSGLGKNDPVLKGRKSEHLADVIMVLRVDPKQNTASLMSIPRDSYVEVAPEYSKSKINSAYGGSGGAADLIATIKHNFGISIDNFVEVDFAGFRGLVEVLGSIPVYNEHPISDRQTGLWLIQTGCIKVDPVQALAYVRSRHFRYQTGDTYVKNGKWTTDPSSDLGRISRQQEFMKSVAQKAIDQGLRNPSTALGLINAGLAAVTTDSELDIGQIRRLLNQFQTFPVEELVGNQLPTKTAGDSDNSYQEVLWAEAEGLLDVFRGIKNDDELEPRDVIVSVRGQQSATFASQFESLGFDATGGSTATVRQTVIKFGLRGRGSARLVASYLKVEPKFVFQQDLPGRNIEIEIGSDVAGIEQTPVPIESIPTPTFPPDRTPKTTSTTTSTTTTTVAGSASKTTTIPVKPTGSVTTTSSVPGISTSTSIVVSEIPTTTAIGVLPFNAEKSTQCG